MPLLKILPSLISQGSFTGSFSGTGSYARRALTASYVLGGAAGSSGTSGATGATGTSGTSGSSGTSGTGSPGTSGTAGSSGVSATSTLQTGSIAKQTLWTNVKSGSTNTITGLNLTSNKWNVNVVEEWDAATLDQYYNSCSLLCHFDTINSAGRFIDNSRNNFTLTSVGNVGLSTTQYKFGGASAYFDGSGDYISTPNTVSNFGTDDFTIECWFYRVSTNTTLISNCPATNTDNNYFSIDAATANAVITIRDNSNQAFAYGPATTLNEWNHIAVTRNSGTVRVFVNGVSGTPVSITKSVTSRSTIIGGFLYTGFEGYFSGYIDELRITKGVARYTSNFTPPSLPFPNSRNQVLTKYVGLVGGVDDKYVDYGVEKLSNTSLKLTRLTYPNQPIIGSGSLSGSVSRVYVNVLDYTNVSVTSSYARNALTASYILGGGANGSSGTSGATGASGTSGSSGTSGATGASGTSGTSGATGSSGTSGTGSPGSSGTSGTSSTPALSLGQTYIGNGSTTNYTLSQSVANRDQILVNIDGVLQGRSGNYYTVSGTTLTLSSPPQNGSIIDIRYINGGSGIVTTGSLSKQTILYNVVSGSQNVITGLNLSGNKWGIDIKEEWDAVVLPGDQYYNSCSLLMHFNGSNGSTTFIDNSPTPKTATPSGNAQISTAQSKFGGASLLLDGTGDYLTLASNAAFGTGTGNFTIEFWMYPVSVASGIAFDNRASGQLQSVLGYFSAAGSFTFTGGIITTGITKTGITANNWYHVACVRSGGTAYLFVDGVSAGTDTVAGSANASNQLIIGSKYDGTTGFNGYIDDFRYTKGVARYTSNFTPPSTQFPDNTTQTQYATKYVGLIGGLNDRSVDYGIQKLSDTSLKVVKMSQTTSPFPSGSLSASVDRVYVNVLDYTNVSVTSSYARNALTASYALTNITECAHLASTVVYTLPNANIVIVPFNTAIILQNITINATASTVGGIEAYHWKHSNTGIFRLVYQVRATTDAWNMISVCKNNNTALPVGNGYRSGIPTNGAWGISFECLYRVTNISDRFGLFHWSNATAGIQAAHANGNPPSTFFVTPDIGTAPTTGYYNSITITKV